MILQATPDGIVQAADLLKSGALVAFPTETVYGLGADATNAGAVAGIYAAKNRPAYNPLIIHVADLAAAEKIAVFDSRAYTVASALWPGPITLVLPAREGNGITAQATAGLKTIAVRVPAHPVAHELLQIAKCPVAAPSANTSGQLSPTNAAHIARDMGDKVPMILAGGASTIGLESTVLDLSEKDAKILRPGAIGIEELEPLIGAVTFAGADEKIKAPGQLKRHYATNTTLRLNAVDVKAGEGFLGFGKTNFIGVEGTGFLKDMSADHWRNLSAEGDLHQAATNLYAMLHELDLAGLAGIAVARIPETGLGIAINDRLRRASVPKEKNEL